MNEKQLQLYNRTVEMIEEADAKHRRRPQTPSQWMRVSLETLAERLAIGRALLPQWIHTYRERLRGVRQKDDHSTVRQSQDEMPSRPFLRKENESSA